MNKYFIADTNVNIRTNYPSNKGEVIKFAPKMGILKKGKKIKICEIFEGKHINPKVKRIWVRIEM